MKTGTVDTVGTVGTADTVIVTVAPTGGFHTRRTHPYVPVTPEEIAADVGRCVDAGAGMAALHARRPDGEATCSAAVYRRINALVRERSDVVVNNSTGGGITGDLLRVRDDGSRVIDWAARLDGVDGGADTCTLDAITAYLTGPDGTEVLMDTPMHRAVELAQAMGERGVKPEWEAFSTTHLVHEIALLTAAGYGGAPHLVNTCLGLDSTFQNALPYTPRNLQAMVDALPPDTVHCVTVNGPDQLRGLAHALALGAHVRVGIEDHGYLDGRPVENVRLVEHVVRLAELVGRTPTTVAQTRELLGLPVPVAAAAGVSGAR